MESRTMQSSRKQIVFFSDPSKRDACPYDVIKLLLPSSIYCAHDLNFVNCFLNNTPPKKQKLIFHWSNNKVPYKAFRQDVLEVVTTHYLRDGEECHENYVIPVPVLFEILGIKLENLPKYLMVEEPIKSDWDTVEEMVWQRENTYNTILSKYCAKYGVEFHPFDKVVKKNNTYMKKIRESIK